MPELPTFVPRSENRAGTVLGDPFNVLMLGTAVEIDSAFRAAGWLPAQKRSVLSVTREVTAAIASRPAITAPVSTQYFEGRPQDLAYELAGPNVRIRHHIRIWLLDSLSLGWVGAANKDVGVIFKPWEPQATHRIDPHIDWERDRVVRDVEASGCGALRDYMRLPGAGTETRDGSRPKGVTGRPPEAPCKGDAFDLLLPSVVLGSQKTAQAVARLVVAHVGAARAPIPYLADLLRYEEAMMLVEAGPRIWRDDTPTEGAGS